MKIEVCILAGGLSTRLGRDKARLKLGGRTMLARIRGVARETGWPVRVIRRDLVARCGPLGGIFTALKTSRADAVLFLACDLPLITAVLLRRVVRASRDGARPVFAAQSGRVGFPFVLSVHALTTIETQLQREEFSLHALARKIRAHQVTVSARRQELFNVNTLDDVVVARKHHQRETGKSRNLPAGKPALRRADIPVGR